jgi:glucose 1-dehydrogenase
MAGVLRDQPSEGARPLAGRCALVTGGTRGIGLAIARGFATAGALVWINGRDPDGDAIAAQFGAQFIRADLGTVEGVTDLAKRMEQVTASLDILVNNAGIEQPMSLAALDLDTLDRTLAVNARAPVQLMRDLLPLLKAANGASVINVTSIHAGTPYAGNIAYCMAKAAQDMATKVAAIEFAPHGIRVNNFAPGAIETEINRDVLDHIGRDKFAEWIPARRVGTTEEMIGPAIFLASAASSYVTGATLTADGAYSLNLVRYSADAI